MTQRRLVGGRESVAWTYVLVMRMSHNFGVMRSIVVTKNAASFAKVCVGIMYADRIAQFCIDHLVEIEI